MPAPKHTVTSLAADVESLRMTERRLMRVQVAQFVALLVLAMIVGALLKIEFGIR